MMKQRLPHRRGGYSDRIAHLMACLSELAYIKFEEPPLSTQTYQMVEKRLNEVTGNVSSLRKLSNRVFSFLKDKKVVSYNAMENRVRLRGELRKLGMQCNQFFDREGTQALLAEAVDGSFLVLAFRGTEATSYKDIRADLRAQQFGADGGRLHQGFHDAYEVIHTEIESALSRKECVTKPLYITGHSLGGALATIAARRLQHKGGVVACYTFGSPRVGDDDWIASINPPIKVPIYRVVNAMDVVTMLPPGDKIIRLLCFVLKFIPYVKSVVPWLKKNFQGYMHTGDMRYLTNCPTAGKYDSVRLLYAVDMFFRLNGVFRATGTYIPGKRLLRDHSIGIYKEKLRIIKEQRNK